MINTDELYSDMFSISGRLTRVEEKLNKIEKLIGDSSEKQEKRRDDRSLFNGRGFPSRPIWPEVYKGRYEK